MRISSAVLVVGVASMFSCADSQSGDSGKLRFGQVLQYAETSDFTSAIAKGQPMPLGVQSTTRPALLNDYPYLSSTLKIARKSDGSAVEVTSTGTGKFEATFPSAGAYVLTANAGGTEDTLEVNVAELAALRLARVQRSIVTRAGETSCTAPVVSGADVTELKSNQSLLASVTAADSAGNPLLGSLKLKFEEAGLKATANLGVNANSFTFSPVTGTTGAAKVTVKDELSGKSFELSVNVTADAASCPAK